MTPPRPQHQEIRQDSQRIAKTSSFSERIETQPERSLIRFNPNDIQREFPHIAKGSYGVVFKGRVPGFQEVIVIKDMEIQNQRSIDDWTKEIQTMSQNRSNYVVEVYGYSTSGNILTIVMEYMKNGSLYDLIHTKKTPLSIIQRIRMARHCALGVAVLHSNKVIHRDVKSMNILVDDYYACKLTDFGCAKLISDRQYMNTVNSGTPLWMAPEVKRGQYSFSADIYSLGLVMFEIIEGNLPYYDQYRQTVLLPQAFNSSAVILPCLNANPNRRPNAMQIVQVLDTIINNIVRTIISYRGNMDNNNDDLVNVYRELLGKSPRETDHLINQAFGGSFNMSNAAVHKPTNSSGNGQRSGNAPNNSLHRRQGSYSNRSQPNFMNGSSRAAPPPYRETPKDDLTMYLEALTPSELKAILTKHNIECRNIMDKSELISRIKSLGISFR
eukprot:TRINITY_DN9407_c0_g1_i2.p1 TRINITY_DN9407_c0_g1~~TRINITY_DN9407_c0_g1_i2.p1  ORF type:complete len:441 (-),score=67.46 TRINITY_DN9407_c0_g1_i2:50-1372(-)